MNTTDDWVCDVCDCLQGIDWCYICGIQLCLDCTRLCSECEGAFCPEHGVLDADLDEYLCDRHRTPLPPVPVPEDDEH